ncbi:penicillin acylase family protein [Lacimonas salitolerans]|uniref:Penicillin acylase family protein n=1 Tax=Lacimonas salitolerans TaxID=1323750 RepID=A0ABW4EBU3_9RHOB
MAQVFHWLLRITGGLIVLALLALFAVYLLAARSLPDYDARHSVTGLTAPVEIVRDNANVPHILGQSDADVYFGLGYSHAQDRLWQMVVARRTAQGRLSEVFGTRTVETDKLMRRLDITGAARASVDALDAETLEVLRAYSAGINARLAEINERALGRGAPEMFLFNPSISPWQPSDSIAMMKLLALQVTGHLETEVRRARVSLVLPDAARLADILPAAPGSGVAALPDYASLFDTPLPRLAQAQPDAAPPALWPVARPGLQGASNAWAAAPKRSAAGGTIMANDPHFALSAPALWYLARLELSTGGVIGATIPGLPVILSGRSQDLGWGIAASHMDDQDLFVERLNPDDPQQYETPDGFRAFDTRREILRIKDAAPVTMTLRHTQNGPVLSGSDFQLGTVTPQNHVMALGWTGLNREDRSLAGWLRLMQARTVQDAIAAIEPHVAPSFNLVLVDGVQIAMKTIGHAPRRDAEHQSQGRMPAPGWQDRNRWKGLSPYGSNPEFIQPPGGILGSTNNKIVDRPFPLHVSFDWGDTQRVQRWTRLMQSRQVHTRDSFIETQLDTVSPTARTLLPLIAADLWFTGAPAPEGTAERRRQDALTLLADWNGEMNEHLPEPLIYSAWLRALQDRLIRDELGPLARDFTHIEPLFIERVYRNVDGAGAWCDVIQSAPVETCTDIARQALDEAVIWLSETYGGTLESLRWGDAHQATHDHPTLGDVPLLRWVVNIRQSTSGGDNTLMRGKISGQGPAPFENVHAAGYRGVYDFTDPDSSVFILATGQSGHPLSRFYDDMGELWRRGEYIPMSLDLDLARAAAVGITRLMPR